MLEKIDLDRSLPKAEFKPRFEWLQERLMDLQNACWKEKIGSLLLFEGWDAAGKGTVVNSLTQRLEPRGFRLYSIQAPRTYEASLPWLWRFWEKLPNYGEMAIFDRSWYGRVLVERVEKLTPKEQVLAGYQDIVNFERALADDGYVILKFFLHISKQEQRRRFKALEKDPLNAWHVQDEDWQHHRKYEKYARATEDMFSRTETEWAPWTIVEATDLRWARVRVFETIVRKFEESLQQRGAAVPPEPEKRKAHADDGTRRGADDRRSSSAGDAKAHKPKHSKKGRR
ncbi:MAG TPA: UDP-galactose-lipid carrier transferase [Verrucomicrobiae bacterium]|nr:UDP-galactose-lipid carrier transferase [Verrucomicrobiae bacterium]